MGGYCVDFPLVEGQEVLLSIVHTICLTLPLNPIELICALSCDCELHISLACLIPCLCFLQLNTHLERSILHLLLLLMLLL
jgi:hypothetical protein